MNSSIQLNTMIDEPKATLKKSLDGWAHRTEKERELTAGGLWHGDGYLTSGPAQGERLAVEWADEHCRFLFKLIFKTDSIL
jgi:hypothetical protein